MVIMGLMTTMGHSCWLGELRKVSHGDKGVDDHHGTFLLSDNGFDDHYGTAMVIWW